MSKSIFCFTFKPAVESQRELIECWLQQDYVRKWIHGQGLQNTLIGLEKFLKCQAKHKEIDRKLDITQHWIGYDNNKPFVYLLTSNVLKDVVNEYAKYSKLDGCAITLDIFIGEAEYLGKGLASQVIKEFLLNNFADVAEIFIDPEQSNERAIHVYQKLGFQIVGQFLAPWHPVPHYIMRLAMKDL